MAIWAINRTHIALHLELSKLESDPAIKEKFSPKLRDNYDGELLVTRVTPDQGLEFSDRLRALGFRGPEARECADFIYIANDEVLSQTTPFWLQIMKVTFKIPTIKPGYAWSTQNTKQIYLYGHPRGYQFRIGDNCLLRPHIRQRRMRGPGVTE